LYSLSLRPKHSLHFFSFSAAATTEIYTLSLHDALPISAANSRPTPNGASRSTGCARTSASRPPSPPPSSTSAPTSGSCTPPTARSEEHTSELQSRENLVCRLLLEKKKRNQKKK